MTGAVQFLAFRCAEVYHENHQFGLLIETSSRKMKTVLINKIRV